MKMSGNLIDSCWWHPKIKFHSSEVENRRRDYVQLNKNASVWSTKVFIVRKVKKKGIK